MKIYYGAEPEKTVNSQIIKFNNQTIAAGNKVEYLAQLRDIVGYNYNKKYAVSTGDIIESLAQDSFLDQLLPHVNNRDPQTLQKFCAPQMCSQIRALQEEENSLPYMVIPVSHVASIRAAEKLYVKYVTHLEHTRAQIAEYLTNETNSAK